MSSKPSLSHFRVLVFVFVFVSAYSTNAQNLNGIPSRVRLEPDTVGKPTVLVGHTQAVTHLIPLENSRYTASASFDQTVKIWHSQTGNLLYTFVFPEKITAITARNESPFLYVVADSLYKLDWVQLRTVQTYPITNVLSLTADAQTQKLYFTQPRQQDIRVLDDSTGKISNLKLPFRAKKITLSNELQLIGIIGFDPGQLGIYSLFNNAFTPVKTSNELRFSVFTFSKDGTEFLTGDNEGIVRLWDTSTLTEIRIFKGIRGEVGSVQFTDEEDMLAACGSYVDTRIFIWNKTNAQKIRRIETTPYSKRFEDGKAVIDALLYISRSSALLAGNRYGNIVVWNPWKGTKLSMFEGKGVALTSVDWSDDGNYLTAGTQQGNGFFVYLNSDSLPKNITLHEGSISDIAFAKNPSIVMSSGYDGSAKLTAWQHSRPVYVELPHEDMVFSIDQSYNSRYVLTSSRDGFLRIWDSKTGELLSKPGQEGVSILAAGFMENDQQLFSYELGKLVIRDAWSGLVLNAFPERTSLWESSPDGTLLISVREQLNRKTKREETALVIRAKRNLAKERIINLTTKASAVKIGVSPDNRVVAIGLSDFSILQLGIQTSTQKTKPVHFMGHKATITGIVYSPNGKQLATTSLDGTLRIWNATTGEQEQIFYVLKK